MNPSDTHITRMAATFAERSPYLRATRQEAEDAWREALHFGRAEGMLEQVEENMARKGTLDPMARDAWQRAKEY